MDLLRLLKDEKFHIFFSFMIGLGIVCMMRPMCSGAECQVEKAPDHKDFNHYVYRMSGGKCYEFSSKIVDCPISGAVETFRDQFSRRGTPIPQCD